ncbi:MAG: isoamylase early set domain-containing protein [Pseudomonadota bacterium]
MSIKKKYAKNKLSCKVTFCVFEEIGPETRQVHLIGDFNGWDICATPMKPRKGGSFSVTVDLEPKRTYQFRYLVNGSHWINDHGADDYVYCPFGRCDNCLVVV